MGLPPSARAQTPTQSGVETALTCQCGCGLTVHSCNHLNCGSGIPLKEEIAQQIAQKKSLAEILSHFETKYGEKILSAPTTRGFNLLAWVFPFVAIFLASIFLGVMVRRWRRQNPVPSHSDVSEEQAGTRSALRQKLEQELNERDT